MTELRYAIAPEGCSQYLTPGKRYEMYYVDEVSFFIADDEGEELCCLIDEYDGHVNGRWLFTDQPEG